MKSKNCTLVAAVLAILAPALTLAQGMPADAQSWLALHVQAESDRLEGVSNIVEKIEGGMTQMVGAVPGQEGRCLNCRVSTVEKVNIPDGSQLIPDGAQNIPDGADNIPNAHERSLRHQLSPQEVAAMIGESPTATMQGLASGFGMMQDEFAEHSGEMLGEQAGVASMLFGQVPNNQEVRAGIENRSWEQDERQTPWLNPFRMFGAGSYMYEEAAKDSAAAHESLADRPNQAQSAMNMIESGVANATLGGLEQIDGLDAMRIDLPVPPDAAMTDPESGAEFVPETASIWIQPETYAMVQHRVQGIATAEGESREFYIESNRSDFRTVPGSNLYEPYRRTLRMGGMLDDKQKAEMAEAQKQLAEFDKQLAAMSPQERQMMESMMGSQMDAIRGMAGSGAFEYVEVIDEILVNADLKALFGSGQALMPASADELLKRIQLSLQALGYQPGNTNGVPDTLTTVAISQYQAERGLAVTGEPSEQLAGALAAEAAP